MSQLYDMEMDGITGESVSLSEYRDQALLIVNLASQCGLTPQYAGLRALQESGQVTILGFPCNQFGAQDPTKKYQRRNLRICQVKIRRKFPNVCQN